MFKAPKTIYVSHPDYSDELCAELGGYTQIIENLVFSDSDRTDICFAMDIWIEPQLVSFESISQAAKMLKKQGRFWYHNPVANVRRGHLIAEELRKLPELKHSFPIHNEIPPIGCFSLLDTNTLVYSAIRTKKPPLGNFQFIEDKINPPNRAYLKLWEALSLMDHYPKPGDSAIDLGASPGGWTYVMQSLGASVMAIDKAELDPKIAKLPRIKFLKQSAFAFDPKTLEAPLDWVLCDVACYPDRTFDLVHQWINSQKAKRLIFTIKLQGQTNLTVIQQFQSIPHGKVLHLFHNKHEVTFFWSGTAP